MSVDNERSRRVARDLLMMGVVGLSLEDPIVFRCGIKSPVYINNREIIRHVEGRRGIVGAMVGLLRDVSLIEGNGPVFDVVAGLESGAIPHASWLADHADVAKPEATVKKTQKDHGLAGLVVPRIVPGEKVLMVEDHVTLAGTAAKAKEALVDAGGEVVAALAITTYGLTEAAIQLAEIDLTLHTLTTFDVILDVARNMDYWKPEELAVVSAWADDPWGWGK